MCIFDSMKQPLLHGSKTPATMKTGSTPSRGFHMDAAWADGLWPSAVTITSHVANSLTHTCIDTDHSS